MKEIMNFLNRLLLNNNREWFLQNKEEFLIVQDKFRAFTAQLIEGIAQFDNSVKGLEVKDCTYRFYRDIRFSIDKRPYKTHFGAYICPKGKKSGYSGYYFHIEAAGSEYIGNNILATGLYCPPKELIQALRNEILNFGNEFDNAVKTAYPFTFTDNCFLQRVPNQYPKDYEFSHYLKLKDFTVMNILPDEVLYSSELLQYTLDHFKITKDYNDILNRVVAECYSGIND